MKPIRICFVGDSVTTGTGDPGSLGWPGRLSAAENQANGHDVSCYNLGIRAETSRMIRQRWMSECAPRLPDHVPAGITFMFGLNDSADDNGKRRLTPDESLENARAMLGPAADRWKVLWLGPTPVRADNPIIRSGKNVSYQFFNDRVSELSAAFEGLAKELGISYLNFHQILTDNDIFQASLLAGDGVHPTSEGYSQMADILENWPAWRQWFQS